MNTRRRRSLGLFQPSSRVPTDEDLQRLPLFVADHIRDLRFEVEFLKLKLEQKRLDELLERDAPEGVLINEGNRNARVI